MLLAELGSVGVRLVIGVFYMNKYFIKDVFNINTVILNDVSALHGLRSETALFLLSSLAPASCNVLPLWTYKTETLRLLYPTTEILCHALLLAKGWFLSGQHSYLVL